MILWKEARNRLDAWLHIKTVISGQCDFCVCTECNYSEPLEQPGRTRESVLREVTRKCYYRHKRWEQLAPIFEPDEIRSLPSM
jgi:hypothetical protein